MQKARVMVVDDEPSARAPLEKLLRQSGYDVAVADSAAHALSVMERGAVDLVVTDVNMPEVDGITLMRELKRRHRALPVLVVTGSSEIGLAVDAMRAGAEDYLTKPVDFDTLLLAVERALEHRDLRVEAEDLRRELREREGKGLGGMIGTSPAMQEIYRTANKVAESRATVLVTGESGTGKGELARAIHDRSPRKANPFVALHCSALAESLLESELFGHEKGSFTGAEKRRIGRFEQAEGGTLFLDEIGEISHSLQVKLLRVLQERTFERVGGNEPIKVDVRVIAATNRDLQAEVREGRFREDLFYRLDVIHMEMPPLRARAGDVLFLAEHFLQRFARESHRRITAFTDAARAKLLAYAWPGNVRELENSIERAVVLCEDDVIGEEHLPLGVRPRSHRGPKVPGATLAEIERHAILTTLEAVGGSTAKTAEMLDISVRTIQYRLHEYGIARS